MDTTVSGPGPSGSTPATTVGRGGATETTRRRRGASVLGVDLRAPGDVAAPATAGPANSLAFTGNARTGSLVRSAVIAIAAGVLSLRLGRRPMTATPATPNATPTPAANPSPTSGPDSVLVATADPPAYAPSNERTIGPV